MDFQSLELIGLLFRDEIVIITSTVSVLIAVILITIRVMTYLFTISNQEG